jgi:hypothetical protein
LRVVLPDTLARLQKEHKCTDVREAFVSGEGVDLAMFVASALSPKNMRQQKFLFTFSTGQILVFHYDSKSALFWRRTGDGLLTIAVDYVLMAMLEDESRVLPDPEAWSMAAWRAELNAKLTGNHRSRRRRVRVPTRAGEPVCA